MGCLVWTCSNNVGVANSLVATGRFFRSFSLLPEFEEFTPVDPLLAIGALVSAGNGGGRQTKTEKNQNKFPDGHALYASRQKSIKGKGHFRIQLSTYSQEADFVDISVSVRLSPRLAAGTSCVTCLATSSYFVLPLLGLATIRHATRRDGLNYR
ncbi:hypothetical protein CI102_352 [Trichoderma harzianum]|nr:hypothetical protein CI102_352 [Trichoderma harzianum]